MIRPVVHIAADLYVCRRSWIDPQGSQLYARGHAQRFAGARAASFSFESNPRMSFLRSGVAHRKWDALGGELMLAGQHD